MAELSIPILDDDGEGTHLGPAPCPLCGEEQFAEGPEVLWGGADGTGRALTVQAFVCEKCGFIAPMLAKRQPAAA